jgi:hypothetical protein
LYGAFIWGSRALSSPFRWFPARSVGLDTWLDAGGIGIDTAFGYGDQANISRGLAARKVG